MKVALLFPNNYLSAADLKGRDKDLTIARLTVEDLRARDGGVERKPLLFFSEIEAAFKAKKLDFNLRLVLNKTNAKAIAKLHGNETDNWVGKRITLYPTTTKLGRDVVDCIRVRDRVPAAKEKE